MGKKFLITEEEKKEIKKLYSSEVVLSEDLKSYIKNKGEDFLNFLSDILDGQIDKKEETDDETKDDKEDEIDYSDLDTGKVEIKGSFDSNQKNNIKYMIDYMNKVGINNPLAQIGILSVISKESNFIPKSEVSYESTDNSRIRKIFGKRVSNYSDKELSNLKKDPKKFFNVVYARTVGNEGGNDGYNYRGRGFNQLTGKGNYRKYGKMIGRDLVSDPDLVNDTKIAAEVAIAFFTKGKSADSFPKFKNKTDAAIYFADVNSGGGASSHRDSAIKASQKFDVSL